MKEARTREIRASSVRDLRHLWRKVAVTYIRARIIVISMSGGPIVSKGAGAS